MRKANDEIQRILDVRRAQAAAAELKAARAAKASVAARDHHDKHDREHTEHQQSWLRALDGGAMPLHTLGAWANVIQAGETQLRRLSLEVEAADGERERLERHRALAQARSDCTDQLHRDLTRQTQRRKDEAAIAEMSDRILGRRPAP